MSIGVGVTRFVITERYREPNNRLYPTALRLSVGSKKVSVVGEAKAYEMVLTTIVTVGAIALFTSLKVRSLSQPDS